MFSLCACLLLTPTVLFGVVCLVIKGYIPHEMFPIFFYAAISTSMVTNFCYSALMCSIVKISVLDGQFEKCLLPDNSIVPLENTVDLRWIEWVNRGIAVTAVPIAVAVLLGRLGFCHQCMVW